MGTDALFENHTIKEIQEIEKKLRNDIEKKKEELRQMVGERYRDLMEAADTITEMKEIAESVTNHVKAIGERCKRLQEGSLQKGILNTIQDKVSNERKQNELLYTVASQIKILMDSPSKIWSSVENKDFISAVSIFLLARHTHSFLMLDPVYQSNRISSQFPIISRQWTSISNLKYMLLQNYRLVLETKSIEPEDVAGPLCCRCFLSNSSLEEIFLDILSVRKDVIRGIFHPEKYAKDQICEFVTVVQITLKLVYVLLYSENGSQNEGCKTNILYEALMHMISKDESGPVSLLDLSSTEVFKFLPAAITEFRPSMKDPIVICSNDFLRMKSNEWLDDIKRDFQPELVNLLNFVNSVKSVALIRNAVLENICKMEHWDMLCNGLLQQSFSIWDFFLKDCFFQRIKDIINDKIKSASEFCQKDIEEMLYKICFETGISDFECERNLSLYVWLETSCDVMDNISWIPRHQRNFWDSGELSMKAMGFTPRVQNICQELNVKLKDAIEDISTFSFSRHEMKGSLLDDDNLMFSSNLSGDDANIYSYLTEAVEKYIFELANYIETTLLYLGKEDKGFENSCRVVFLGRLCYALMHLCPYINICLSSEKIHELVQTSKSQGMRLSYHSNVFKESELWKQLKGKFLELSNSALKLWSEHQIEYVLKTVDSELVTCSAEGLLKALLKWDKIEIQEESEQGKAVKSVLRIPQHISLPLFNSMFAFCCKLNAVGGYAINSDVRTHISKQLLAGLLNIYKEKVNCDSSLEGFNSRLLQVQSLQLLFDVQFLIGLMVHKDNSNDVINQLSQDIVNKAVSYIDPFDMDVFSAPLQQNLKKALQKSLSLFGLIASPDQVSYLNSIKAQSVSTQMEHNIMLASNVTGRFPLLPLSSRTGLLPTVSQVQFSSPSKEAEVKTLPSHSSSPNLSESDIPSNSMKSTSFYDRVTAMSSSWFGS